LAFWAFLVFRTEFSIRLWKPLPRTALYSFTFLCITGAVSNALEQEQLDFYIYAYWFGLLLGGCFYFRFECLKAIVKAYIFISRKES